MLRAALVVLALTLAAPALAQQPLPDAIRSASLTQAQADELNRRLTVLRGRFNALAGETQLREAAVRNIAVEIFGAQPDLDFETYVTLIVNGARELRALLTEARGRTENDPALAALRAEAIAAAEAGRLTEARRLYDNLIARSTETLEALWAREDAARAAERGTQALAVVADMAEAARLAFVAADYLDAGRRYGEAAERANSSARRRAQYRALQASSWSRHGDQFNNPASLRSAAALYGELIADDEVSRTPQETAVLQNDLGTALLRLAERTDPQRLSDAIAAFESARRHFQRADDPIRWARVRINLGAAYARRDDEQSLVRAVAELEEALTALERFQNAEDWGRVQLNLGVAYAGLADRGNQEALVQSMLAYDAALTVFVRERSEQSWAEIQVNRANGLLRFRNPRVAPQVIEALQGALEVLTAERQPYVWAHAQANLALAYSWSGDRANALRAYERALTVTTLEINPASWGFIQYNVGLIHEQQGDAAEGSNAAQKYRLAAERFQVILDAFAVVGEQEITNRARQRLAELQAKLAE